MPSNYVRCVRHKGVYTTTGVAVPADELPGHAFFEIYSFEEGAVFGVGEGTRMYAQASLQHHQSPTGSKLEILSGYMSE
ncbi:TPA: hypothetical protein ACH3X1_005085 [Trebouxia sp. C0004]